jgi:tetratricopeptide (TPR) repeat protein
MSRASRSWLAAVAVAVAALASPRALGAAPDRKAAEAEGRDLYQKAIAHYDLAEYDRAIDEFKQAYELTNKPELLFNLAQAYRAKKDWANALHFYRTYLSRKPQAANRADVETFIAEAEREQKAAAAAAPVEPKPVEEKPIAPVEPKPIVPVEENPIAPRVDANPRVDTNPRVDANPRVVAVAPPPRPLPFLRTARGRAVLALSIAGGALLLTSAVTGGVAVSKRGAYDTSCAGGACNDSLYVDGRGLAISTDVLIGVGVAAGVTALVLFLTRPRSPGLRF